MRGQILPTFERGKLARRLLPGILGSRGASGSGRRGFHCAPQMLQQHPPPAEPFPCTRGIRRKQIPEPPILPLRVCSASFSSRSGSGERADPFARRPTSKCDPYDQGGKPLTLDRTVPLMGTIETEWNLLLSEDDDGDDESNGESNGERDETNKDTDDTTVVDEVPFGISRVYWHDDYLQGAKFCTHVAAVAQMNAQHFPHEVILHRKLQSRTKTWKICTTVVCRTHVLQGLSHHDFYLATLIDIEAQRPEVRGLLATTDR